MQNTFDLKSSSLEDNINNAIEELRKAYGRNLRKATSDNIYVQHARGKLEAFQEVKIMIRRLTVPDFVVEAHTRHTGSHPITDVTCDDPKCWCHQKKEQQDA